MPRSTIIPTLLTALLLTMLTAAAEETTMTQTTETQAREWWQWKRVKVAACQVEIHTGREAELLVQYIDRAGAEGCELIVCGEYLLGAFHDGRGPVLDPVREAARRNGIYVVVGGWGEDSPGAFARGETDAYANTALLIDRRGEIVGSYDKTHQAYGQPPHCWPPVGGEVEYLMRPGDGYPTFQLEFARIGIMTCYDGFFAESAACLSLQGAEIICWINGRAGPVEPWLVQADCFRQFCAIISTNLAPGSGTMIAQYPNVIHAHVQETGNHYISAEIDLEALREARANSRMFHQRRPELYQPITTRQEPWKVYEALGHEEPELPPRRPASTE